LAAGVMSAAWFELFKILAGHEPAVCPAQPSAPHHPR
jgi:hypothetical protein